MTVALCAIAKNEDKYVDHWVKHYFDRGFDHITIYDNNDEQDLICIDKSVEVINVHGKEAWQLEAYEDFYKKNKNKFDWIAYFDLDEFLDCENIKTLLDTVPSNAKQIQVKSMTMSDSGFIHADYNISPFEKFIEPSSRQYHNVKSIINTNNIDFLKKSVHFFTLDFSKSYFPDGSLCNGSLKSRFRSMEDYNLKDFIKGQTLHHCDFKTIEEYIKHKWLRTDAVYKELYNLSKPIPDKGFFSYNKKTLEKLQILSKAPFNGLIDLIIDVEKQYTEELLKNYRKVYIKNLNEDLNKRVKSLKGKDPIDIADVAEFYIENGKQKRKSIEQIKKYFS